MPRYVLRPFRFRTSSYMHSAYCCDTVSPQVTAGCHQVGWPQTSSSVSLLQRKVAAAILSTRSVQCLSAPDTRRLCPNLHAHPPDLKHVPTSEMLIRQDMGAGSKFTIRRHTCRLCLTCPRNSRSGRCPTARPAALGSGCYIAMAKEPRQLRELRNLIPFAWDDKLEDHPAGAAVLRDFKDVFSWRQCRSTATPHSAPPKPAVGPK